MALAFPLSDYDFALPSELIAQEPASPRHASRLMVLPRRTGEATHRRFEDLPALLQPSDLLVVNRTRVFPARLPLRRETGGKVEALFVRPIDASWREAHTWLVLGRPGGAFREGRTLVAADGTQVSVRGREGMHFIVELATPAISLLERLGQVPLPPYIERAPRTQDASDYQTVFAREVGSVAAPTASLHFSEMILEKLSQRGVRTAELVLHVGPGTFLPIRPEHADDIRAHVMHAETYEIPEATLAALAETRARGGRIIGVGTTSTRALESWASSGESRGDTKLFIYPGFEFRAVDGLITNFHLPRSTLLVLVSAFAGRERVLAAYEEAVGERYRFFSYGDAMFIQ